MFGFSAKLPISEESRRWADAAFKQLSHLLGRDRLLQATVILPEDRFFPDPYDGSNAAVRAMANRVAVYMGVDPDAFIVEIYAEGEVAWRESVPNWRGETQDAAGLYFHEQENGRFLVGLRADQLKDPISLVATLAHELAHVVLLGGGLVPADQQDMEPLTDVCTVFLGLGFFTASSAFQFKQWTDNSKQGWSTQRRGYLSEPMWGYALARFAKERAETRPAWAKGLPSDIRAYFNQSGRWLDRY